MHPQNLAIFKKENFVLYVNWPLIFIKIPSSPQPRLASSFNLDFSPCVAFKYFSSEIEIINEADPTHEVNLRPKGEFDSCDSPFFEFLISQWDQTSII